MKPLIGLMLGDVTGIGPELVVKLLSTPAARERANVVIIGDERVLQLGMRDAGLTIPYQKINSLKDARHDQA
jgi:4-hydroxy-L-threonine phosphate dehydrogenase PdxA